MRSIEARFRSCREKYPELSDFVVFGRAIKGQKFSSSAIRRWFYKLVDKEDYVKSNKQGLLEHLIVLNTLEEDKNKG